VLGLADPTAIEMPGAFAGPSPSHWLGQDQYGRDVLSRLVWGARTSFAVALSSATIAVLAGTALGLTAAYYRGLVELVTVRPMDILLCFPPLLLALLVVTLLGPGTDTLVAVLALVFLPNFARVAYGTALSVRERDFVTAMQAIGASPVRIILRTLLPNIAGPLLVQFSLVIGAAIILEAGLSFLGLGAVPPTASWGLMIGDARATMLQHPLLMIWPCLALSLTILGVNIVCDGLRDRIDPHPIAESLFGRKPAASRGAAPSDDLLSIDNLSVSIGETALVKSVSLAVRPGEVLALVGASGSGKSLTSLAVMGLLSDRLDASGRISMTGQDVLSSTESQLRRLRGRDVAMIFQDPASGLNPAQRVGRQIGDAIRAHQRLSARAVRTRVLALMAMVEIPDPERRIHAYPHQLSGGMRQRIMIAMAIANRPRLLIADEPTTALDVTVQAQILATLARLKQETGMGILFVTHSLGVVAQFADRVAVMKDGEIVEAGAVREVLDAPAHPYTRLLIRNAPENLEPLGKPLRPQIDLLPEVSHA
jgi:peptide/nickel transport system permease protein